MDLNMSKEPRQNAVKPQLLAEDFKKIGDRSGSTIRICVSLTESTKSNCPELNFIELSTNKQNENRPHLDAFSHEEDEEIKKIAESLSEKYGYSKKKNKRKIFMGLGEGYNLEDSFIDDDDAYEEEIPWEYDPLHVGYYINRGTLLCTNEPPKPTTKNNETRKPAYRAPNDGGDDDDDDDDDRQEEIRGKKKMRFSDEEEKSESKKRRIQISEVKPFSSTNDENKNIKTTTNSTNTNTATTAHTNQSHVHTNPLKNNTSNNKTNKSTASISKLNTNNTKDNEATNKLVEELKNEVIEELTRSRGSTDPDDTSKIFTPPFLNKLTRIYSLCQSHSWKVKMRVFEAFSACSGVQKEMIFKRVKKHWIEGNREKVTHAKNILQAEVEKMMEGLMEKYKQELAERDRLRQEMKAALAATEGGAAAKSEGRGAKQDGVEPSSGDSNDGGVLKGEVKVEAKVDSRKNQAPRKKFVWNASTREKLREVVGMCMLQFDALRIKSQSAEEYLKAFFDAEVLPIWPPGWMQTRILLKESRSAHIKWTTDPSRPKVMKVKKQQKRLSNVDATPNQPSTTTNNSSPCAAATPATLHASNSPTRTNQSSSVRVTVNNTTDLQHMPNNNNTSSNIPNISIIKNTNNNINNIGKTLPSTTTTSAPVKAGPLSISLTLPTTHTTTATPRTNLNASNTAVASSNSLNNSYINTHNNTHASSHYNTHKVNHSVAPAPRTAESQQSVPMQHASSIPQVVINLEESPPKGEEAKDKGANDRSHNNNHNSVGVSNADFTTLKRKSCTKVGKKISIINLTEDDCSVKTDSVPNSAPALNHNATSMSDNSLPKHYHNPLPPQQHLVQHLPQQQQQPKIPQQQQFSSNNNNNHVNSHNAFTTPEQQSAAPTNTQQMQHFIQQAVNRSPSKAPMTSLSPPPPSFRRTKVGTVNTEYQHKFPSQEPFQNAPNPSTFSSTEGSFANKNDSILQIQQQQLLQQQLPQLQHAKINQQQRLPLHHQNLFQNANLGFNQPQ